MILTWHSNSNSFLFLSLSLPQDMSSFDDKLFEVDNDSTSNDSGLLELTTTTTTTPYHTFDNNSLLEASPGRMAMAGSSLKQQEGSTRRQRPTRSKRAAAVAAAATLSRVINETEQLDLGLDTHYPALSDLGVTDNEDTAPRKRQPRVSYSTLTEEERYHRIRELNNVASRVYREKKVKQLGHLQKQEAQETVKNKKLQKKAEALQRLRDEMERYTQNFMRQHMGGAGGM